MERRPLVLINGRLQELPVADTVSGVVSEEDQVYAKKVDFVSDTVLYRGEAAVGSTSSSAVWRIRKIVLGADGDVDETWASGNANFDKIWDNRVSLSYS